MADLYSKMFQVRSYRPLRIRYYKKQESREQCAAENSIAESQPLHLRNGPKGEIGMEEGVSTLESCTACLSPGVIVPEASLFFVEDEKSTHVVRAYQLNDNTTSTIVIYPILIPY